MKAKAVLSAMSLFRVLVFLIIPILLMPITSEAKQRITAGGKTVVVDSFRVVEDQFEITYNGRVLKGPADQLSAVITAIAIHEQENNRNQEVPERRGSVAEQHNVRIKDKIEKAYDRRLGEEIQKDRYKDEKPQGGWNLCKDIDGNTYSTIKIGDQWWMAENLKVTRYRNSEAIYHVIDDNNWGKLSSGGYCSYDNDAAKAETYGYLYNWYAVTDPRCLAPEGWHVPSDAEWQTLVDYLGGSSVAGGKMKETTHWLSPNIGATNESGFSALPGGCRNQHGNFDSIGHWTAFWSSTETYKYFEWLPGSALYWGWTQGLDCNNSGADRSYGNEVAGYSVRCVRD